MSALPAARMRKSNTTDVVEAAKPNSSTSLKKVTDKTGWICTTPLGIIELMSVLSVLVLTERRFTYLNFDDKALPSNRGISCLKVVVSPSGLPGR